MEALTKLNWSGSPNQLPTSPIEPAHQPTSPPTDPPDPSFWALYIPLNPNPHTFTPGRLAATPWHPPSDPDPAISPSPAHPHPPSVAPFPTTARLPNEGALTMCCGCFYGELAVGWGGARADRTGGGRPTPQSAARTFGIPAPPPHHGSRPQLRHPDAPPNHGPRRRPSMARPAEASVLRADLTGIHAILQPRAAQATAEASASPFSAVVAAPKPPTTAHPLLATTAAADLLAA